MTEIFFLTVEHVIKLHALQIAKFGGDSELRDSGLLESACAVPPSTFGNDYLHHNIYQMAAAYLYHLVKNHPFVDGNKRTGLICALVFLEMNGCSIDAPDEEIYSMTYSVAAGNLGKSEAAEFFRKWDLLSS